MYSEESCGKPAGGGMTVGGCASTGSCVSGEAAGGASDGAPTVVVEAGVAVAGRGARFDGLGIGCDE